MFEGRRVRRTAGRSAMAQYEDLKKDWQRQHRTFFRSLAAGVGVIVLVTLVLSVRSLLPYFGGMLAGGALCFLLAARESPPGWISNYLTGAVGEERTAKALTPLLKKGWVVVHDLSRDQSNVDHVVVGPGGVFVLDSKNLSGSVVAESGMLHLTRPGNTRRAYSHDYSAIAKAQARYLNSRLRDGGVPSRWVEAVIVVWADFPQQSAAGDRMSYVHGDHLVDWLLHRPARLNGVEIDQIADLIRAERPRPAQLTSSER